MDPCTLKFIFSIFCLIIALAGLYLAFLREHKNIKVGALDPQDGTGDLKSGKISFKFAIGLVLIVIGVIGGFFSIKNLPGCEPNNNKPDITNVISDSSKNDENIHPTKDSTKGSDSAKLVKPSANDSTPQKKPGGTESRGIDVGQQNMKVVWKLDEKIVSGTKSIARNFDNSASFPDPLTLSISGFVQYPVIDDVFEKPDKGDPNQSRGWINPYKDDKAVFQVFINGQTNELWYFSFSHKDFERGGPEFYQKVNKKILFNKPRSEKIKVEILFTATTEEDYLRYRNANIIKGFKIEIGD